MNDTFFFRTLAKEFHVSWKEYWPFLDKFIDLASEDGLKLLEEYLRDTILESVSSFLKFFTREFFHIFYIIRYYFSRHTKPEIVLSLSIVLCQIYVEHLQSSVLTVHKCHLIKRIEQMTVKHFRHICVWIIYAQ